MTHRRQDAWLTNLRRRAGVVVFLEFAATLPIFCILFMGMMSFHRHYQNTRHAYALARLGTDINLDTHHSGRTPPQLEQGAQRDIAPKKTDDALAQLTPAVNHLKVNEFETRTGRTVTAHGWWGNGYAAGYHRSGRDNWSHYDIDRQIDRENIPDLQKNQPQESMKYIFQIPNARTDTEKGFLRI